MPVASQLAVANAAGTTVTFTPESVSPALTKFVDRTSGVSIGFRRINISSKFANAKSSVNRSKLTVELPVITTVNGVNQTAYTLRANVDMVLPEASSATDRNDLFAFTVNALQNTALVRPAMRDLDPIY